MSEHETSQVVADKIKSTQFNQTDKNKFTKKENKAIDSDMGQTATLYEQKTRKAVNQAQNQGSFSASKTKTKVASAADNKQSRTTKP